MNRYRVRRTFRLLRRRINSSCKQLRSHVLMQSRYFSLGARGERAARRFLERSRYLIWEMNHRSKFGEIDIIASHGRTLVFVEVKTRSKQSLAYPTEKAIDQIKQRRMQRAGRFFVDEHVGLLRRRRTLRIRFDVMALEGTGRWLSSFKIVHHEGAIDWKRSLANGRSWRTSFSSLLSSTG